MIADVITAFSVVSLASAGIGAILTHLADTVHHDHQQREHR